MGTIAKLAVILDLVNDGFDSKLNDSSSKLDKWGKSLRGLGTKLSAGITAPLTFAGGAMINWAADLDESINKSTVLFGTASDDVLAWSTTTARGLGMSQQAALDFSSSFAGMLKPIAANSDELGNMSMAMTQLAGDFGSFNNLSPEESFTVISSALAGETEAIRRFGVDVSAAAVEQKALEEGLAGTASELTEQDKLYARYLLILEQTTDAQGDFERTQTSTSNRLKTTRARIQDLGASFGRILLPYVNQVLDKFGSFMSWLEKLDDGTKKWVVGIAAVAAALGPLLMALGIMLPAISAIGAAIAFLLSPVGLIIAAIALLAAGLIYAYTHFDGFREAVDKLLGPIGDAIDKLREFVGLLFGVPETKTIGITLNTSLSDPEDAWSNWTQMPDGSWKHGTLGITSQALDGTVTEMLDPSTGEKSWNLNVDVDGDGSADALKIIDSVDQGGGKFVMTVEIDGKKYEAWYDENTGQTIIVPMEVEITNEEEVNSKLNKLSRRKTFEIWLKVINGDILDRLQDKSDAMLVKIQQMADAFGNFVSGLSIGDIPGMSSWAEAVEGIKNDYQAIKDLISWIQGAFSNGYGSESLTDEQEDVQYGGQGGGGTNIGTGGGGGTGAQGGPTRFGNLGGAFAAGSALASTLDGKGWAGAVDGLNSIVDAARKAGSAVGAFATSAVTSFGSTDKAATAGLQPIPPLVGQVASSLTGQGVSSFVQINSAGQSNFGALLSAVQSRFTTMQSIISSTTSQASSVARSQASSMTSAITSQVTSMSSQVQGRFSSMQGSVSGSLNAMTGNARNAASQLQSSLSSGAAQAAGAVQSQIGRLPGMVAGIAGAMYGAGADAIQGLVNGAQSRLGALEGVVNQAIAIMARIPALGNSPWPMMIGAGHDAMDGLIIGVDDREHRLNRAIDNVVSQFSNASPTLRADVAGSGGNGDQYITIVTLEPGKWQEFLANAELGGAYARAHAQPQAMTQYLRRPR